MAQKIVRASDGREIKPASEEKKARKAAAAAEQVEEKAKSGRKIVQAEPTTVARCSRMYTARSRALSSMSWAMCHLPKHVS